MGFLGNTNLFFIRISGDAVKELYAKCLSRLVGRESVEGHSYELTLPWSDGQNVSLMVLKYARLNFASCTLDPAELTAISQFKLDIKEIVIKCTILRKYIRHIVSL